MSHITASSLESQRWKTHKEGISTKDTHIKAGNTYLALDLRTEMLHHGGVVSDEETKLGILTDIWTRRDCVIRRWVKSLNRILELSSNGRIGK